MSRRFGGKGDEAPLSVARDPSGNILLGGFTSKSIDFGTGQLMSAGGHDGFLAKLTAAGDGTWARLLGDASFYQEVAAVAVDANGNVLAAGAFSGAMDFGSLPLQSAGATDAFVAKYPP